MFGIGKKLAEEATQQAESAAQVAGKYQSLLFPTPAVLWVLLKWVPCSPPCSYELWMRSGMLTSRVQSVCPITSKPSDASAKEGPMLPAGFPNLPRSGCYCVGS